MRLSKIVYAKLPKDQSVVLETQIKWPLLAKENVTERVVRPWVAKKVKEYLGVEEQDMISLVVSHL